MNEVKILKLPNFEKITEKRRKRATTRYVPSILEDNEKAFFLTAKKCDSSFYAEKTSHKERYMCF